MIYSTIKKIIAITAFRQALLRYQKNRACFYYCYILMIGILLSLFLFTHSVCAEENPKFLIIHLDAICSNDFFQYMEEGYLPNLESVFSNGNMIQYGLSLFPGGTEIIYPRLKEGLDNSIGESVGWGYFDREKEKNIPPYKTFFYMFSQIPRRARASFVYGVPFLDIFHFLPMSNIPELLETYGVVELIWFATDSTGHALSRKKHFESVRRFDRYFGNLVKRLKEEVNFILYSDHGMCFDNPTRIYQDKELKRIVEKDLVSFIYPNIYINDPELKDFYALKIVQESEIDFTFYQKDSNQVIGYSCFGKVIFNEREKAFQYLYEGKDVFGYYADGYQGEWLTAAEWLSWSRDSEYPAVPPNLFQMLSHEHTGDIVIVINSPKIAYNFLRYSAHHHGITHHDLMVPILLKGKDLEHLYGREEMWLHNLFTNIPALSFHDIEPEREKNRFTFWGSMEGSQYPGFELSISPAYRWNVALRYEDNLYKGWFEYDLYSSYVIRLWTGVGLEYQNNAFEPFIQARLQMDFGKIQFNYGGQSNWNNLKEWQENRKELLYKVNNRLSFNWQIPNQFGFSFHW
ncbi:MAG: alkaline phosphatase family protein [Elusimicrobiota bacterium]